MTKTECIKSTVFTPEQAAYVRGILGQATPACPDDKQAIDLALIAIKRAEGRAVAVDRREIRG